MASFLIHMAVAHEVSKQINSDYNKLLLGSVAPDISKLIGEKKDKTHFIDEIDSDVPNMHKFMELYQKNMNDDFVLGYYIHLYTDYLWYKYFLSAKYSKKDNYIKLYNGDTIPYDPKIVEDYSYIDYTNMNYDLVNNYGIKLDFIYQEIPKIDNIIKEIDVSKLDILTKRVAYIYDTTVINEPKIFTFDEVKDFINDTTIKLIDIINAINILNGD